MPRTLRTVSWVVALLAVLATGAGYLYRWYQAQQADAWALELDGRPAPSFTLASHGEQTVRLDDFTGRMVGLTLVHCRCTDRYPGVFDSLVAAHREPSLNVAEQVALVTVTVVPECARTGPIDRVGDPSDPAGSRTST